MQEPDTIAKLAADDSATGGLGMRRTAVWIILGVCMGAGLSFATRAGVGVLRPPAQSLPPAEDGPNCTALVLDRVTGLTKAAACRRNGAVLLEASVCARSRVRT